MACAPEVTICGTARRTAERPGVSAALRARFALGALECTAHQIEVVTVGIGRPRFAVVCAAVAAGQGIQQLGGDTLQAFRMALGRAREELGPEEYDALRARFEAMSYDDAVSEIRAELDRVIADDQG